jgi:hypothetical protein
MFRIHISSFCNSMVVPPQSESESLRMHGIVPWGSIECSVTSFYAGNARVFVFQKADARNNRTWRVTPKIECQGEKELVLVIPGNWIRIAQKGSNGIWNSIHFQKKKKKSTVVANGVVQTLK